MIETFFYAFLALLGLGFLVFIHELGHYFVARRAKMKIEVFSIGLGKPLYSWYWQGVKWQICPLLFGGYVKIAGMEKEGGKEPHEIADGFYAKGPFPRIKVALAGPIANIAFAFIAFSFIWVSGGREKDFSEFTRLIGFVDPHSALYQKGIRPGDELLTYNKEPFKGRKDLLYAGIFNGRDAEICGNKIDYFAKERTPYDYTITPYHLSSFPSPYLHEGMMTIGITSLARYLIYQGQSNGFFSSKHPMAHSGIVDGDRIVWINGTLIFSIEQLSKVIQESAPLITFVRKGKVFVTSIPRMAISDLELTEEAHLDLLDWGYESGFSQEPSSLLFLPYQVTSNLVVEEEVSFIDANAHLHYVGLEKMGLQKGDQILAVNGNRVTNGQELVQAIQDRSLHIIVQRDPSQKLLSWKEEDRVFTSEISPEDILPIISSIGTDRVIDQKGTFRLLRPVTPVKWKDFPFSPEDRALLDEQLAKRKQAIEEIKDPSQRKSALQMLRSNEERLILGIPLRDRLVIYNPGPFSLFRSAFQEMFYTFAGLIKGEVSPKFLVGPVGIVQVMQNSWGSGAKEALFWLGFVSLNLGILNLLPIPVLDGGHICFSLIEAVRKKPLQAKTMRRLILPFVALLIFFFLYVTYHDIMRLFGRFFF